MSLIFRLSIFSWGLSNRRLRVGSEDIQVPPSVDNQYLMFRTYFSISKKWPAPFIWIENSTCFSRLRGPFPKDKPYFPRKINVVHWNVSPWLRVRHWAHIRLWCFVLNRPLCSGRGSNFHVRSILSFFVWGFVISLLFCFSLYQKVLILLTFVSILWGWTFSVFVYNFDNSDKVPSFYKSYLGSLSTNWLLPYSDVTDFNF